MIERFARVGNLENFQTPCTQVRWRDMMLSIQICRLVLKQKHSRQLIIQHTLLTILPRLAAFQPRLFVNKYVLYLLTTTAANTSLFTSVIVVAATWMTRWCICLVHSSARRSVQPPSLQSGSLLLRSSRTSANTCRAWWKLCGRRYQPETCHKSSYSRRH